MAYVIQDRFRDHNSRREELLDQARRVKQEKEEGK